MPESSHPENREMSGPSPHKSVNSLVARYVGAYNQFVTQYEKTIADFLKDKKKTLIAELNQEEAKELNNILNTHESLRTAAEKAKLAHGWKDVQKTYPSLGVLITEVLDKKHDLLQRGLQERYELIKDEVALAKPALQFYQACEKNGWKNTEKIAHINVRWTDENHCNVQVLGATQKQKDQAVHKALQDQGIIQAKSPKEYELNIQGGIPTYYMETKGSSHVFKISYGNNNDPKERSNITLASIRSNLASTLGEDAKITDNINSPVMNVQVELWDKKDEKTFSDALEINGEVADTIAKRIEKLNQDNNYKISTKIDPETKETTETIVERHRGELSDKDKAQKKNVYIDQRNTIALEESNKADFEKNELLSSSSSSSSDEVVVQPIIEMKFDAHDTNSEELKTLEDFASRQGYIVKKTTDVNNDIIVSVHVNSKSHELSDNINERENFKNSLNSAELFSFGVNDSHLGWLDKLNQECGDSLSTCNFKNPKDAGTLILALAQKKGYRVNLEMDKDVVTKLTVIGASSNDFYNELSQLKKDSHPENTNRCELPATNDIDLEKIKNAARYFNYSTSIKMDEKTEGAYIVTIINLKNPSETDEKLKQNINNFIQNKPAQLAAPAFIKHVAEKNKISKEQVEQIVCRLAQEKGHTINYTETVAADGSSKIGHFVVTALKDTEKREFQKSVHELAAKLNPLAAPKSTGDPMHLAAESGFKSKPDSEGSSLSSSPSHRSQVSAFS